MLRSIALLLASTACNGSGMNSDTDGGGGGLCGAVTQHSLQVEVRVVDGAGAGVPEAAVRLEEREWEPGTLGEGQTDAAGDAVMSGLTVTGVEDCWGVVLDYVIVVEKDSMAVETSVNSGLFNAIESGEGTYSREVTLR